MTNELQLEYFDWLCNLIGPNGQFWSYRRLLRYLFETDFDYFVGRDGNRADRGVDLRYKFGEDTGHSQSEVACLVDIRECSVLELMVALAIDCEERIMQDHDVGNRTGQWFWEMVINLGLENETDTHFSDKHVRTVIEKFINREYEPSGKGGLFYIPNSDIDMRMIEIWHQLYLYLNERIE